VLQRNIDGDATEMNLPVFFLLWGGIFLLPIPPTKSHLRVLPRLVTFLLGLFLFLILVAALTPLSLFVYWLVGTRLFIALFEYAFSLGRRDSVEEKEEALYRRGFRSGPNVRISARVRLRVLALLFILFLLFASVGIVFTQVQRVSNAYYFQSFIQRKSGLPVNGSIPDSSVRLVTEELARSVARRHMSEFGSNVKVIDTHVTKTLEGKLVWLAVIGSTNVLAENYVKGFIVIDAADPVAVPEIVKKEFLVGDGLWWNRNIIFRSYLDDITYSYGVAYPTWSTEIDDLVYVVARYQVGFDLIRRYAGLIVYDSEGNVIQSYLELQSVPVWATQVYDEDWMENMINEWGTFRRGESFDYWAGGFLWIIPPSRDRVEMSEDTRYIVDPETDSIVAMVMVNPVTSDRTLAGVFKATRESIFFYDYQQEKYISGITVEDIVEGKLPKPAAGYYNAEMPLLYPVEISEGVFRLAWYTPIYWREGTGVQDETIYLAGFAIIDALDINTVTINIAGSGLSSEQIVRTTRLDFMKLFGAATSVHLDTVVEDKQEYVRSGVTHVVLQVTNSTYRWIEATPDDLPSEQWYELLSTKKNDMITADIEKRGDTWTAIGFDNLDIP
jgi:hypothetical protein